MFPDFKLAQPSQLMMPYGLLGVCAAIFVLRALFRRLRLGSRPRMIPDTFVSGLDGGRRTMKEARQHFVTNCLDMMLEGYQATKGDFFYVPSPSGERLMIPTRYIEELKNAPDNVADFTASFMEMFEGKYTTIGQKWHLHPGVVKGSLNANLAAIMPVVEDEIRQAFDMLIPSCKDWTPLPMAKIFTDIISRASNRMMRGIELSRNAEWTATSINFTTDTWLAAQRLKQFPAALRPLASFFIPEIARVRHHGQVARRVIIPLVERMLLPGKEKPVNLLQMLWDGASNADKTPEFMAYTALAISFAAIRTSSSVPTHLLYDLCAHPEYIEPLRSEVKSMLAEEGGFTKAGLKKLVKLDSFMKESQRFNPLSLLTFGRVVHNDLTLRDGITIPAGTFIGVPVHAIHHDPALYPDPECFRPFRFLPKATGIQQAPAAFVTTTAFSMSWGYGRHACSGRFFAANEIKAILAHFLVHYDFKLEPGMARPANTAFELQVMADESAKILVRERKEEGFSD